MTKLEAVHCLINDILSDRLTRTQYRRLVRALGELGLSPEESAEIERRLEYRHHDGTLREIIINPQPEWKSKRRKA